MADDNKDNSSAESKPEAKSELPVVESPPLSPAGGEPQAAPEPKAEPIVSPADGSEARPLPAAARFHLRPRHKRQAVLAASVTIAACIGAIIGALAMSGMSAPPPDASRERQAMQQSIGQLNKEIASLKASIEAGNKSARSQIAKITDKISERINHPPETTGSIPLPPAAVPTPSPRPPMRPEVVRDWSIHDVRDGYVYVQGHGDIYQVVPGAPLPGLGPVREIKREAGRWIVVTPKGLIVSMRNRRFFE